MWLARAVGLAFVAKKLIALLALRALELIGVMDQI